MSRVLHNTKLLILSVILSLACVYIIKHPYFFVSSVLNLQEIQEIQTKQWDIAYKTDNQILDVFMPLSGDQQGKLNITLAYDPTISIYPATMTGQIPYTYTTQKSGFITLEFATISGIDPHQSLFYLPFSGSSEHILVEEASIENSGTTRSLAIGKISPSFDQNSGSIATH